jgi:hypothetical protein
MFPVWIEFSGLPEQLAQLRGGPAAWSVLKKLIELDCETGTGTVEISITDLAARTAVQIRTIRQVINTLRKGRLIAAFVPNQAEEPGLFKIQVPLPTPTPIARILHDHPELAATDLRYAHPHSRECATDESRLQEITDLYFNVCGLRMNQFVLDELDELIRRHPMDDLRAVFNQAKRNGIHSLQTIRQDLNRIRKTRKENPDAIQ